MAFQQYDSNFISVLPAMRTHEAILADIAVGDSGRATDIGTAQVAAIELAVRTGAALYWRRQYEPALDQFRDARASIYALLYPGFDVGAHRLRKDVVLPVSLALETGLLNVAGRMTKAALPTEVEPRPPFRVMAAEPLPQDLASLTQTGFRESAGADEILQTAAGGGLALLNDNKPEAAIDLMNEALAQASTTGIALDPSLAGAMYLNLAAAYLQNADLPRGLKAARMSLDLFGSAKDSIGMAQSLHASAIATQRAGDPARAKELFTAAATTLEKARGSTSPPVEPGRRGAIAARLAVAPAVSRAALGKIRFADSDLASRDVGVLQPIAKMDANTLTLRLPGRADGWATLPALDELQRNQHTKTWNVGVPAGAALASFKVGSAVALTADEIAGSIYKSRVSAVDARALHWPAIGPATVTFYLTQLYAYTLPVKIGDCYHQMGQYARAETHYLQAAQYSYLNPQAEAGALWIRLARNAIDWGDSLYKRENLDAAKAQYAKLITQAATVPDSFLYSTASLAVPAAAATTLIQNIATRPLPALNWEIAFLVLNAFGRLQQIAEGLDFFGLLLSPIHTFEYLQSVARGFAQEAIQAEREFVNFKSRQESEEGTRRDLETADAMAQAEADGRYQQFLSAVEDQSAAQRALELAVKRRDDAVAQRAQYAGASSTQIWSQAAAQAQGMGEDSWYGEISELADKLARGESISGPRGKLAAAYTLYAGRKTRDYELQKMQDNIDELGRAIGIATDQRDASVRRTAAAEIALEAAKLRAQMADASLDAFDGEFFTPESWSKMADVMRDIAGEFLYRAMRIARLMERAYNFENDTELRVIKAEYGHGVATPAPGREVKLLGGDSLLQDIESFTYNAITTKTRKNSRIKDVISLASAFPAQFEQFRNTGLLSFETDLYEFDRLHPGFFGQRIEAAELEIIGLLPDSGLNGTLSAGGVTSFRKKNNTLGSRVHQVDTMALSSFMLRNDMFLYGTDTGVRGLFQGIGLGGTWQLHLPKRSNDFDFTRIFDVNLVLYYNAKFDAGLRSTVLALPPRAGEMALLRNFALRQDFPDAWYGFYRAGVAEFELERLRLPANQIDFKVNAAHLRVMTRPGVAAAGIDLRITAPGGASGTASTDAAGVVSTELAALAALAGGDPVGAWRVEVLGGAPLLDGEVLKFDRVYNLQFGLEYAFEYAAEVL